MRWNYPNPAAWGLVLNPWELVHTDSVEYGGAFTAIR